MKPDMSKSNAICDISSPSFLTPTTLKNITQILESEECMKSIQTFEETGDADKAKAAAEVEKKAEIQKTSSLRTRSRNTYFNLGSKSWQGGITTVGTPTECVTSVTNVFKPEVNKADEEDYQSSDEENNSSDIINGHFLPESVVQTNIKQQKKENPVQPIRRTMITRSLSNMSNSSNKHSTKTSYPSENKRMAVARKTSIRGRKITKYNFEEETLSPDEKERLRIRRQRNKEAAARCRKRRVDQTNGLQAEVDQWMEKKRIMEDEIVQLKREKDELEFILTQHCQSAADGLCVLGGARKRRGMVVPAQIIVRRPSTATNPMHQQLRQTQQINVLQRQQRSIIQQSQNPIVAIKSEPTVIVEPVNQPYILPEQVQIPSVKVEPNPVSVVKTITNNVMTQPLRRPGFLGLTKVTIAQPQQQNNKLSEHGITIDTPSSIVPSLNFDTFTSTGLTPTATPVSGFSFPVTSASTSGTLNTPMTNTAPIGGRCSTQQRSSEVATGSVSDINSPEGISLVSL